MRYYISDLHFFHESLNSNMDKRGFASIEDMHATMINKWNAKVRPGDDVYILGDFSIGKPLETMEVLARLNGRKYLIVGNHDKFIEDRHFDKTLFKDISTYAELKDNKRKVVLSHYPIFCYKGQNILDGDGNPKTYMLYGHVHDTLDEKLVNQFINITKNTVRVSYDSEFNIPCAMINCFCMFSDYAPLSLDEWIEVDKKRREAMGDTL